MRPEQRKEDMKTMRTVFGLRLRRLLVGGWQGEDFARLPGAKGSGAGSDPAIFAVVLPFLGVLYASRALARFLICRLA